MKKIILISIISFVSILAKAQQNFFVYIQTDNKQPFYVKFNNKILSSSSTGYLVISKLNNGNYDFIVGFPKDQWPQQNLSLNIENNDLGFNLKNFGEKGWGLFNIQTLQITMNNEKLPSVNKKHSDNDDAFAAALNGKEVKKPAEKPVVEEKMLAKETKPVAVNVEPIISKETIQKINTINDVDGILITYVLNDGIKKDTVNVFTATTPIVAKAIIKIPENDIALNASNQPLKDSKFLDIELQNPNSKKPDVPSITKLNNKDVDIVVVKESEKKNTDIIVPSQKPIVKEPVVEVKEKVQINENSNLKEEIISSALILANQNRPEVPFNSDCKNIATEDDFKKIRKKMAAENTDADMIIAASKYFKTKCFMVEQIKNLSLLFLNDKGKYSFFDEAYPYTKDTNNFNQLQAQLHDAYYINRFKAMIGY